MLRSFARSSLIASVFVLADHTAHATTAGPVTELTASNPAFSQRAPTIDFDGTYYVIVWEDNRNSSSGIDLYYARLNTAGVLQDAMGNPLLTPQVMGDQTEPAIFYNPAGAHLIVWTDPRDMNLNIYAIRLVGSSYSIVPSGGLQVSSEAPDADNAPHAAFASTSPMDSHYLVTWQSTLAGTTQIRGRRFAPTMDPEDTPSFDLSSGGGNSESRPRAIGDGGNFIIAWEDDRNSATSGLDLYARTLPDTGAVSADPGLPISTEAFGQQKPDIALLNGNLAIVWDDDRLGPGVDRNIWRNLFDPMLAPLPGGELVVSAATDAQQRPRIAADATGGMMVWQDFRNGPVGIIYGARLDASGALRDPDGFPLLAFTANGFEQVVTKGPMNDYLVAAVRFDATAPRIFYRIIRDEPPGGTMTLSGTLQVPADGATTANVTFGPARGTSGTFDVVDGTLYTLTLSRADVTPNVTDQSSTLPGLQIRAVNGTVNFGLSSFGHGPVTVTIASVDGNATGQGTVTFDNVSAVATNVVLGPPNPNSVQDLTLTYTYSDINNDPESGTAIEWLRNSAVQSLYANMTTLPNIATIKGDQWRARVTPNDGIGPPGAFVFSNTLIIGNTPPSVSGVHIDPNVDVKTGTGLRGRYLYDDADSDPEMGNILRWFDHGAEVAGLAGLDRVPGPMVIKGQEWTFEITPNDGTEFGAAMISAPLVIANSTPEAHAGENIRLLERRTGRLDGTASLDIDPQDILQYQWAQITGTPAIQLSSTASATPTFVAPSIRATQIFTFDLIVTDGEAQSTADSVTVEINPVIDTDADGLDDEEEAIYGTDPEMADTDRDGLSDADEIADATNPLDEDTDDDGVRDGVEGRACPMCEVYDPAGDPDGDLMINALDPDSDNDGLIDGLELAIVSPPVGTSSAAAIFVPDADRDTFTNPVLADTDLDGLIDGVEDANHNGKVDPGESDPNDPTDPPKSCTPNGNECPPTTECRDGTCKLPLMVDGGLTCRKLADQMIECCSGGCSNGTSSEPICMAQGALEQCGVGAQQCQIGSCSVEKPGGSGGDSCGCTTTAHRDRSAWSLLALVALLVTTRRGSSSRRRTVRRTIGDR